MTIFDLNNEELIKSFEFQCIYIKPSYLSGPVSIKNEIEKIKIKYQFINNHLKKLKINKEIQNE